MKFSDLSPQNKRTVLVHFRAFSVMCEMFIHFLNEQKMNESEITPEDVANHVFDGIYQSAMHLSDDEIRQELTKMEAVLDAATLFGGTALVFISGNGVNTDYKNIKRHG